MQADRFGNPLSTASPAAAETYIEGYDALFSLGIDAPEAFARAIAEDPSFTLAYLGAAQAAAVRGDMSAVQSALTAAKSAGGKLTPREASHLSFFSFLLTGQSDSALDAAAAHLAEYPRDGAVMNHYGPILGLISMSGRP